MYTAQRVIKYCAIGFAVLLICGIISAIVSAGVMLSYVFGGRSDDMPAPGTTEVIDVGEVTEQNLTGIYLDLKATNVVIGRGAEFVLESDPDVITVSRGDNALYVQEKDFNFLTDWGTSGRELRIVLPEDWRKLDTLRLNAGAGKVEINNIQVKNLELNLGAGKTEVNRIVATERAKIDGGAGYLAVRESELKDLDLDMGVGKVELGAKLLGNCQIDAGVGKLEINLQGVAEEYRVKVEKGLGSITLNGEKLSDGTMRGEGVNLIDIDGGVGAIEIRTE